MKNFCDLACTVCSYVAVMYLICGIVHYYSLFGTVRGGRSIIQKIGFLEIFPCDQIRKGELYIPSYTFVSISTQAT